METLLVEEVLEEDDVIQFITRLSAEAVFVDRGERNDVHDISALATAFAVEQKSRCHLEMEMFLHPGVIVVDVVPAEEYLDAGVELGTVIVKTATDGQTGAEVASGIAVLLAEGAMCPLIERMFGIKQSALVRSQSLAQILFPLLVYILDFTFLLLLHLRVLFLLDALEILLAQSGGFSLLRYKTERDDKDEMAFVFFTTELWNGRLHGVTN